MSLLNLFFPIFDSVDVVIGSVLPGFLCVAFWGLAGAVASMGAYWCFSLQGEITEASSQAAKAKKEVSAFDGEFKDLKPLMVKMLATSLRHLRLVLVPALVASIPLIFLLGWMSQSYSHELPIVGEQVRIITSPDEASLLLDETGASAVEGLSWPSEPIFLHDRTGTPLLEIPLSKPVPVIHKWRWWNFLVGNLAGYLPAESKVEAIDFQLRRRILLGIGPTWVRTWEPLFFTILVLTSLLIKFIFRIR